MSADDLSDKEIGSLHRLRRNHPDRSYAEILEAFHTARTLAPGAEGSDVEVMASYILDVLQASEPHS